MRQIFASVALALLSIGSAEAGNPFVDLALYRPSTAQFFIRTGLNGSVTAIAFGAPGDHGLLCKFDSNTINGADNLLLYRNNGLWFVNHSADGATVDWSFTYFASNQPLCGNYGADTTFETLGLGSVGFFSGGAWYLNGGSTPPFFFGQFGDVAVHIGAKGYGNATDRRNMIYGVYRAGTWFLDETGSGAPTRTVNFGGLSQDVPLLIPHWNGAGVYSLAIYRDGIWFIKPDPSIPTIVTVPFGAPGDIPLVRNAH